MSIDERLKSEEIERAKLLQQIADDIAHPNNELIFLLGISEMNISILKKEKNRLS